MPYQTIEELPERIKGVLPKRAEKIFLKVFNNAYDQYDNETLAFRVAWHAVKLAGYKKDKRTGKWRKR